MFCDYLRKQGINPDDITKKYIHTYPDGRQVSDVNQYPDTYYSMFTDWLKNVWIKEKSLKYVFDRMGMACLPHMMKAFPNQIDALPMAYLTGYSKKIDKRKELESKAPAKKKVAKKKNVTTKVLSKKNFLNEEGFD